MGIQIASRAMLQASRNMTSRLKLYRTMSAISSSSSTDRRTASELARLIQVRVDERETWDGPGQKDFADFLRMVWDSREHRTPIPSQEELDIVFPLTPVDWESVASPPSDKIQVTWLGHSSLLVQMGGCNVLTDPVFDVRASPVTFAGPKRYRPPACRLEELSEKVDVDFVLLSHNHYDHLSYNTVRHLASANKDTQFVVPLGLKGWMESYVTNEHTIHELDWHESTSIGGIEITSVPMKHWSNRYGDRDSSLWCGYVMNDSSSSSASNKFLFPGDTAWFEGLHDIGKQYGPFDLAAIPIGAYAPRDFMKTSHINVEEAIAMKKAVQATMAVPIHWGTFPMTTEPVMEPREKLVELMEAEEEESSLFAPWFIGDTKIS